MTATTPSRPRRTIGGPPRQVAKTPQAAPVTPRSKKKLRSAASTSGGKVPPGKVIEISDTTDEDEARAEEKETDATKLPVRPESDVNEDEADEWDEVPLPSDPVSAAAGGSSTLQPATMSERRIKQVLDPLSTDQQAEAARAPQVRDFAANSGSGDARDQNLDSDQRSRSEEDQEGSDSDEFEEVTAGPSRHQQQTSQEPDTPDAPNPTYDFSQDPDQDAELLYGSDFHADDGSEHSVTEETTGDPASSSANVAGQGSSRAASNKHRLKKHASLGETIEVTLGPGDGLTEEERKRKELLAFRRKPLTARDRAIRLEAHKLHVMALLANASIRNKWLSDDLLKARLLSLTPHELHANFHIPPSRFPDPVQRSRLFLSALQELAIWWANDFFEVPDGSLGIRTRSWDEVMDIVDSLPRLVSRPNATSSTNGKGKGKSQDDEEDAIANAADDEFVAKLGEGGERIRTVKSLMKKALQGSGGRDTSAQLFVSLCRALGLGARLVISLQPVQWKSDKQPLTKIGAGRAKRSLRPGEKAKTGEEDSAEQSEGSVKRGRARRRGDVPEKTLSEQEEDDEFEEVNIPEVTGTSTKGSAPNGRGPNDIITIPDGEAADTSRMADPSKPYSRFKPKKKDIDQLYRLRKDRPQAGKSPQKKKKTKQIDLTSQPPIYWAEVYDRPDQKWIPVDPVRGTVKRKKDFEPPTDSGPIRMLYVVAFEEDGSARDVTLRYAKNFSAKTVKLRVPSAKDGEDWWDRVMKKYERPFRLRGCPCTCKVSKTILCTSSYLGVSMQETEPFLYRYVLERHLKREEVIQNKREIGRFKGEPVYRRSTVVACKTPENWMRIGRKIKEGQEPLKWVKQRAVTLDKRRAAELAELEGQEPLQQGLYAEWQTELYRPPPIKDGHIPTNSFGNIDLYVPTMLPKGASHLPYKGIAKVAKQLGVQFAEACTGFEFKKQRAIPVITGIVVPKEKEEMVMDAYWASETAAYEKELTKKQEKALQRWKKLVKGIQIRSRLQQQYGSSDSPTDPLAKPRYNSGKALHTSGLSLDAAAQNTALPPLKIAKSSFDEDTDTIQSPKPEAAINDEAHNPSASAGGFVADEEAPSRTGGFMIEGSDHGLAASVRPTNPDGSELVAGTAGRLINARSQAQRGVAQYEVPRGRPRRAQKRTALQGAIDDSTEDIRSDSDDEVQIITVPDSAESDQEEEIKPTRSRPSRKAAQTQRTAIPRAATAKKARSKSIATPSATPVRRSLRSHAKAEEAIRKSLEAQDQTDEEDL